MKEEYEMLQPGSTNAKRWDATAMKDEKNEKPATDQQMIESRMIKDQQIKIANHIANRQNENVEKFLPEEYVENTQLKNIVAVYY